MTAEERTLIEIQDIDGFEFECPKCGARFYIPIDKYDTIKAACANCREDWFETQGSAEHVLWHQTLQNLRNLRRQLQQPNVKVRFQVNRHEVAKEPR